MNPLAGTTWTFNLPDQNPFTFTFNANGSAYFNGAAPTGNDPFWTWGESSDGTFMLQALNNVYPGSTICEVYFGQSSGNNGSGHYNNGLQAPYPIATFNMVQVP